MLRRLFCLSLTAFTLTACDAPDPILGNWEGAASGCTAKDTLEIADEQGGEGKVVLADCSVCNVDVELDKDGDEYDLELVGVGSCDGRLEYECEVQRDELECEDINGKRIEFERD
jgi:hypothetical protein